jgi:uncharacterized phiE125 gp8 family phage protein
MMLSPVLTVAPATTPVTLPEAKAHLRVLHDDDDDLIVSLIETATAYLDGWSGVLGRAIMTQTWRQNFSAFGEAMRLALGPVASVTSITYFDGSNVSRTLATSVYALFTDARGSYVALKPDQTWPATYGREDAVSITFAAGADAAPAPIKTAILIHVAHLYMHRGAVGDQTSTLPLSHQALIAPHRKVGV